jgi:Putative beta-barrel porin-2, OmpL-like. bbp2
MLNAAGVGKSLTDLRINVAGYVEVSYNYNFSQPDRIGDGPGTNLEHLFDFEDNEFRLNQLDLSVERKARFSATQFDIGFKLEGIFGSDARLIHANGLDFNGENGKTVSAGNSYVYDASPTYQADLFNAYLDMSFPLFNGLQVRLGKFESFFGGTVDPNQNVFFSHSIAFANIHPFSFTGALATYRVNNGLYVSAGVSRGWDQATEDNNDSLDVLARVVWNVNSTMTFTIAGTTGQEDEVVRLDGNRNGGYRTQLDATLRIQATDQLKFIIDGIYGWEPEAFFNVYNPTPGSFTPTNRTARWYGLTGIASYTFCPQLTVSARGEYFMDEQGLLGFGAGSKYTSTPGTTSGPYGLEGFAGGNFEVTLGATITPFANMEYLRYLKLRPEFRADIAEKRFIYGANYSHGIQELFAIDAIYSF